MTEGKEKKPVSILQGLDVKDEEKRRKEILRAGFSEYEIMTVIEAPDLLKPLIHQVLHEIPFYIPMRILKSSWGETFLRDVRLKGEKYEKGNILAFPVGAAISPHDKTSLIFQEFSPELIILPDGRVSFTRSRVYYRGGLGKDIAEFNLDLKSQEKFIYERVEQDVRRNPALLKKIPRKGRGIVKERLFG